MKLNEIRIGGIYKTSLEVSFRSQKEIKFVDFFVRVVGKTSQDNVEVCFLNDNTVHYLEPHQLYRVE